MLLAAADAVRVAEGSVGVVLALAVLGFAGAQLLRRRRASAAAAADPGVPALARSGGGTVGDPAQFGGGALAASIERRKDAVVYGYLAVAEHFRAPDGASWVTLSVVLPGRVPFLAVDNRVAAGRPGVPMDAPHRRETGDPAFDATYTVAAEEPWHVARLLTPKVRATLLRTPVQRLALHENALQVRTFDGAVLDDATMWRLDAVAEGLLGAAPSFVTPERAIAGRATPPGLGEEPLPRGRYGPD